MTKQASSLLSSLRAGWLVVVVALALVGAGCGPKPGDEGRGSATTVPGPLVLDYTALTAALVTPADLPPGWTEEASATGAKPRVGLAGVSTWASTLCKSAKTPLYADQTVAVKGVSMARPSPYGPGLQQSLASTADAEAVWQLLRGAFDSCVGQTWTNMGENSMETTHLLQGDQTSVTLIGMQCL